MRRLVDKGKRRALHDAVRLFFIGNQVVSSVGYDDYNDSFVVKSLYLLLSLERTYHAILSKISANLPTC